MCVECKACWLNHLDVALEKYNNRVHTLTRMTPFDASNDKPIPNVKPSNTKLPKVQVGDFVAVPDKRNIYSKRKTSNWNRNFFKRNKINNTNPVEYGLEDQDGKQIQVSTYSCIFSLIDFCKFLFDLWLLFCIALVWFSIACVVVWVESRSACNCFSASSFV